MTFRFGRPGDRASFAIGEGRARHVALGVAWTLAMTVLQACGSTPTAPADTQTPSARHASPISWTALRDRHVVRQQQDYSCGAAALATLLSYDLDDPASEAEILIALADGLSKQELEARQANGFSLLDLQRVAQQRGHRAAGFRLSIDQLEQLSTPAIVFIEPDGYEHFAVLRGVADGTFQLADPSRGNARLSRARFASQWLGDDGTGVVFLVESAGDPTRSVRSALADLDREHASLGAVRRLARRQDLSTSRAR